MAGTFQLSVVTPERVVLETAATFVAFPAHDGEVGVLPGRAPFLFEMGIGELRAETPAGNHKLYVDGGFAQMVEDRLTLLTDQAKSPEQIDRAAAEKALAAAHDLPMETDADFNARQRAIRRAQAQLKLAG